MKAFNIETNIEALYSKKVTKFGNGAKIDSPKKHIGKDVTILILKKKFKNTKTKIKKAGFNIGTEIEDFYNNTITKFGTGAKISCSKNYVGKDVIVLVH